MARRINHKCLACAQLPAEEARHIHGPDGDGCWHDARCHRRRSHYRNRRDNNARRRTQRRQQQATQAPSRQAIPNPPIPAQVDFAIPAHPVAYLYLYRGKRQDAPLHAIAISVWQGTERLLDVTPIHCAGLKNQQIRQYLTDILQYLREHYQITKFEPEIRLEPSECPISECPLKQHPVQSS